jgi:hypothetical protein
MEKPKDGGLFCPSCEKRYAVGVVYCPKCRRYLIQPDEPPSTAHTEALPGAKVAPQGLRYSPAAFRAFVQPLSDRANGVIAGCAGLGVVAGAVAGAGWRQSIHSGASWVWIGALLGGIIGLAYGVERVFWLRFQAQAVLCQAQIEENTRKLLGASKELAARQDAPAKDDSEDKAPV